MQSSAKPFVWDLDTSRLRCVACSSGLQDCLPAAPSRCSSIWWLEEESGREREGKCEEREGGKGKNGRGGKEAVAGGID